VYFVGFIIRIYHDAGHMNATATHGIQSDHTNTEVLTFKHRIKSHLPFAGIIRSSPYSPRFQAKG